ncbi:MAG: hypothetical protein GXX99_08445 [Clostridiales bacterium]|nr:hypothetical protein [Clostridiales bacterium]
MWIAPAALLLLAAGGVVVLRLPFSPTRTAFEKVVEEKIAATGEIGEVFTEQDIAGLPLPVQNYFRHCGYLGTPKMAYMRASLTDVDFVMSAKKTLKIDYSQFNLVQRPERFALISSSLYGIPFEGLDAYENGRGSMKGVLAKWIPLFDQRGEDMDRACLVTWLAECLMFPNAALQEFVAWKPIDDTHAQATITWEGLSASGVFTFAESGELQAFRTGDRVAVDMQGNRTLADWSAYLREYREVSGILQPTVIQSVWHYPEGDCIYFNEQALAVSIRYQ